MKFCHYPDVTVTVYDVQGDQLDIVKRVVRKLQQHGVSEEDIDRFIRESCNGDKDDTLRTVWQYVDWE